MKSPHVSLPIVAKITAAYLSLWAFFCLSCSTPFEGQAPGRDQTVRKFSLVKVGTDEAELLQLLGPPSEVRIRSTAMPVAEKHALAYGASGAGAFAQTGIVSLDQSNQVIEAVSPTEGYAIRQGARLLPRRLDMAFPVSNILCVIKEVTYDPKEPDYLLRHRVKFALLNQTKSPCVVPVPLDSIRLCVAVEVYDEHGRLFFRKDNGNKGSVYSGEPNEYPSLVIEPGSSVEDYDCIWLSLNDFGKPPQGVYYVRVAFGFHPFARSANQFTVSKACKFHVP